MLRFSVPPALFFLLASAASFPKDLNPLHTVGGAGTARYPYFRGLADDNDTTQLGLDFQSMLRINQTLFIAARDHVYAFNLQKTKDDFSPSKHLTWKTQDMENCAMRGKLRNECYNYIKVLVPKNNQMLLACGTNAFNPMCRTYKISTLEQEGEELNGQARCPFDAKQANVALFADGNLYSATVADFQASDAVIYRSLGERSPVLRTVKYDSKWLREPHFVHALEYGDYVYLFFREISMEYTTLGRVVFSRVGRVCKNDMGGSPRVLEKYWTSFLKARLNCSVPGDSFFYFDVLQAVTEVAQVNGHLAVFGVFATQSNSITGSAVCAFYMDEIERVFGGKFKEQKTADAAWTPIPEEKVPKPRPGCCTGIGKAAGFRTSNDFPDEMLSFIKSFPLLDEAVPSVSGQPWFTRTASRYKLTHLAVDTTAGPFKNYTVLFLGSEDGTVLKILSRTAENSTVETVLLDEISVYNPSRCSVKKDDRRVLDFELDKANHALYVAFSGCVVRVPLSRCSAYSACRRSCLASRDPYCVWSRSGSCVTFSTELRSGFEQDVESAAKNSGNCQDVVSATGNHDGTIDSAYGVRQDLDGRDGLQTVHFTFLIGCVFVAFVLGAFLSGLLVSCYCNHSFQKAKHVGKDPEGGGGGNGSAQRPLSLRSLAKMNGLLENQSKDGLPDGGGTKLYTTLLPNEKEPLPPGAGAKPGLKDHHPELSALPTPESTPELPMKNMKAIRNQWEKNQNFNNAKESQGKPSFFHAANPPAFSYPPVHGYEAPFLGYQDEKKIPNSERVLVRHSQCFLPKGMEVTTLEELLKHLHETNGHNPKVVHFPNAAALSFANRVQPKIPDVESAPYYSSSTLPRDSLPRRLDVPPDPPPPLPGGLDKPGRHPAHRHSLCGAPKLVNAGGGGGGMIARHHSLSQAGRPPPPLLTRMHSTGTSLPHEGHPHALFLSRQHSYGDPVLLPGHGGMRRSVSMMKPGNCPSQPLFMPSSSPPGTHSSGPFNY